MRIGNLGAEIALTRHAVNDHALIVHQLLPRERANALGRRRAIALDIFLEIVGRAEVMIVLIESIGDAAKPAESLESADDVGLDGVPRALDLGGRRAFASGRFSLPLDRR